MKFPSCLNGKMLMLGALYSMEPQSQGDAIWDATVDININTQRYLSSRNVLSASVTKRNLNYLQPLKLYTMPCAIDVFVFLIDITE